MATTRSIKYFGDSMDDVRQCLVALKDIPGLAAAGVSAYFENPFDVDAMVEDVIVEITTLEAGDEDIDIGFADAAAGTNHGTDLIDSLVNTSAWAFSRNDIVEEVNRSTPVVTHAAGATPCGTLKAKGATTDSFFCAYQNGTNGVSTLVYSLYVRLIAKE